jgi:acetyl esterase/lipase
MTQTYRAADGTALDYDVFYPEAEADRYPAIVLFFGGGWWRGTKEKFHPQAAFFIRHGYAVVTPDIRVKERQGAKPRDCVADGVAFWNHVRQNAAALRIDPARIALGGGSSGAHVAVTAALQREVFPKAFILYNPGLLIHTLRFKLGYGFGNGGIDPFQLLQDRFAPAIFLHGGRDRIVPLRYIRRFAQRLDAIASPYELHVFPEAGHGFFNQFRSEYYFDETNKTVLTFLKKTL